MPRIRRREGIFKTITATPTTITTNNNHKQTNKTIRKQTNTFATFLQQNTRFTHLETISF